MQLLRVIFLISWLIIDCDGLILQRRVHSHMQRMGGLHGVVLLRDQKHTVTVGQEKRIVVWNMGKSDPVFSRFIDDENDEGNAIAM